MVYTIVMKMKHEANPKTQQYIGRKIREARERRNFIQQEVADAVGISITHYAGIERGEENPTLTVIENICKALKVKSSDILPF